MSESRYDVQDMTPEKAKELKTYVKAIAAILYEETPQETLNTKDRNRTDSTPKGTQARQSRNWCFFIQAVTGTTTGRKRRLKSSIGSSKLTKNQAKKLEVKPNTQALSTFGKVLFAIECKRILSKYRTRIRNPYGS